MLEHTVQKVQQLLATASSAVLARQGLEAASLTVFTYEIAVVGTPLTTGKNETGHEETHDPFLSHGLSSGDKGKGRCTEILNACLATASVLQSSSPGRISPEEGGCNK